MLALLMSVSMRGQYNPTNPAEPGMYYTLTLQADPSGGGSFNISTTTSYSEGTTIALRAYNNTNFVFVSWEQDGEVISTASSFSYQMPAKNVTLVAHYKYSPSNPEEPSEPDIPVYSTLYIESSPSDGGYFNISSGNKYEVGSSVQLRAYAYSNFTFQNWTENDEIISTSSSFNYVMKEGNPRLVANFAYTPSNPTEPSESDVYHRLYLKSNPSNGGYFNVSSGNEYKEGSGVHLVAYTNQYYSFDSWTLGDSIVSTVSSFYYVIPNKDVTLTANYSYDYATTDDPESWNDVARPHLMSFEMTYPTGLNGIVEYMVEDDGNWTSLPDTHTSGEKFTATLVALFKTSRSIHTIKFRANDQAGNTPEFYSVEYPDVSFHQLSGIENKIYTGEPLYQTNVTCDLDMGHITLTHYQNNVNAGTASFNMEGVYPYTIGRKTYTFKIDPQPLAGELKLTATEFVYSGQLFTPVWQFTNEDYAKLEVNRDYTVTWHDNLFPGAAMLAVHGKGNYTGELTANFTIDKAPMTENLYELTLPDKDIAYDEKAHGATISTQEGVGKATITYAIQGTEDSFADAPSAANQYDVYLEIEEGSLYYGMPKTKVWSFSIFQFDEEEWTLLQALYAELIQMGGICDWNISAGLSAVASFKGVHITNGYLTGIDLSKMNLTGLLPQTLMTFTHLESVDLSSNNLAGDISATLVAAKQINPQALTALKQLNISGNSYVGNIGMLASCLPALTSLKAAYNKFEDVYPMISATVTDLDISCQQMDRVVELNMSDLSIEDMTTKVPSILLYDHESQTFRTGINMLCTTADLPTFDKNNTDEWAMQLLINNNQINIPYVSAQNAYYGESGDTLNVQNLNEDNTVEGSSFRIKMLFKQGDANFVNGVDATDLQTTILYAFGSYRNMPFNHTAADTYKDLSINVQDVICTVNILLEDTQTSANSSVLQARNVMYAHEMDAYIYRKGNQIFLHSNTPIASMSIKATGNINWNVERYGITQSVRNGNMVSYSLNGTTLPSNTDIVIGEGDNFTIYAVSMSDSEANPVKATVMDDVSTSIGSINVNDSDAEIYDVSGMKRNTWVKGINIVKHNGKTIKLFKK